MNAIFKGVRPLDYVLAALATGAGAFLMYENITAHEHGLAHPQSTTTAAMLPFFLAVTHADPAGAGATSSRSSG